MLRKKNDLAHVIRIVRQLTIDRLLQRCGFGRSELGRGGARIGALARADTFEEIVADAAAAAALLRGFGWRRGLGLRLGGRLRGWLFGGLGTRDRLLDHGLRARLHRLGDRRRALVFYEQALPILERVGKKLHFLATLMVAIGTFISAFWILSVNSWMQTPVGFEMNAQSPFVPGPSWTAIIFNPSFPYRLVHTVIAAYLTTALVVGVTLLSLGTAALSWWRFSYADGATSVVVTRGLLSRSVRTVPNDRIRGVEVETPVLHRLFGLVRVRVDAAAGAVAGKEEELVIDGVYG